MQLPIRGDKIEACEVHQQLCDLLEDATGRSLFTPHMSHVLKIFAACLAGDEDEDGDVEELVHETTKVRIKSLVQQINVSVPSAVMQEVAMQVTPREREALTMAITAS